MPQSPEPLPAHNSAKKKIDCLLEEQSPESKQFETGVREAQGGSADRSENLQESSLEPLTPKRHIDFNMVQELDFPHITE